MGKWMDAARAAALRMRLREQRVEQLEHRLALPVWAELDGGASLRTGDTVRYLLHEYVCILSHTKSLARRPTNTAYWEQTDSASFSF